MPAVTATSTAWAFSATCASWANAVVVCGSDGPTDAENALIASVRQDSCSASGAPAWRSTSASRASARPVTSLSSPRLSRPRARTRGRARARCPRRPRPRRAARARARPPRRPRRGAARRARVRARSGVRARAARRRAARPGSSRRCANRRASRSRRRRSSPARASAEPRVDLVRALAGRRVGHEERRQQALGLRATRRSGTVAAVRRSATGRRSARRMRRMRSRRWARA